MYRSFLGLTALASVLALPLTAHADTVDDFVLTGGGHTISYSLPASTTFVDGLSIEYFSAIANETIDGVPGYVEGGQYDAIPSLSATLQLFVPETIFGFSAIQFQGPLLTSYIIVPSTDPVNPFNVVATFIPGAYDLLGQGVSFYPSLTNIGPPVPYTLTITPQTATATTPEPPSWALLATGIFGLLGFAAIKRGRIEVGHRS